jgi:WXG100 family type VII secretion target
MALMLDQDAFATAKDKYSELANRMEALKVSLQNAVESVEDGWKSNAGDEFFRKFNDDWMTNIENYIEVIRYMSSNIDESNRKYGEVYTAANNVKFE